MISTHFVLASFFAVAQLVAGQSPLWGQCGGINWTGSTTCVSGSTCTKLNDWYYQCLPNSTSSTSSTRTTSTTSTRTTSTTSTRTTSRTSSSSTPTTTSNSGLPRLKGVNMAGYDFTVYTNGSFSGVGYAPPTSQFSHFSSQGVNVFRVPFAWQLMTPTLGGTIDSSFFSRYDATVRDGLNTGAYVILDLHNYARWNGGVINQGGPTTAQFTSIWSQLAAKYASNSKIIFGLMNEPHDMPAITPWIQAVQAAVNAIRAAGATSQIILLPGSSWSGAAQLPTEAGPQLLQVTDPAGGVNKLVFDVHKYLDVDNSGTHDECVTDNLSVFQNLVSWLKTNNRQAILSETGGGHTQSCYTYLYNELAYIKNSYPTMIGFTVWSAGAFNTVYELSVTPNADGSDQQLWIQAVKPNL
ncbi:Manganese dependent endoglucanase Eg5A [Serendipita sp. 407]|nr:Manganese dependent endoglucanase Eg5A [Serendipita sp. 407]